MKAEGNTGAYVGGTAGRPIPHIQTTGIRPAHASQEHKKESTFDWDAHTPTCTICGQKSGSVAEGVCSACRPVLVPTLSLVTNNTRHPQTSASAETKSTDPGPADHTHQDESTGDQGTVPLQLPTTSPSTAEAEPQPINWAHQIHGIRAQLQRPTSAQTIGDAFRILADAACTLALLFDQLEEATHKPTEGEVSRLSPSVKPTGPGTGKGKPTRVQSATNHRTNKEGHN